MQCCREHAPAAGCPTHERCDIATPACTHWRLPTQHLPSLPRSQVPYYPQVYSRKYDNVLVVAASDDYDEHIFFSNFDPSSVHLSAPGVMWVLRGTGAVKGQRALGWGWAQGLNVVGAHHARRVRICCKTGSQPGQAPASRYFLDNIPPVIPRGCRIYTTAVGGMYNWTSGTSIAAPFVSGAAALLQAVAQASRRDDGSGV